MNKEFYTTEVLRYNNAVMIARTVFLGNDKSWRDDIKLHHPEEIEEIARLEKLVKSSRRYYRKTKNGFYRYLDHLYLLGYIVNWGKSVWAIEKRPELVKYIIDNSDNEWTPEIVDHIVAYYYNPLPEVIPPSKEIES